MMKVKFFRLNLALICWRARYITSFPITYVGYKYSDTYVSMHYDGLVGILKSRNRCFVKGHVHPTYLNLPFFSYQDMPKQAILQFDHCSRTMALFKKPISYNLL